MVCALPWSFLGGGRRVNPLERKVWAIHIRLKDLEGNEFIIYKLKSLRYSTSFNNINQNNGLTAEYNILYTKELY